MACQYKDRLREIHTHTWTCKHTHRRTGMYMRACPYMYVSAGLYICIQTHVCVYVSVCISVTLSIFIKTSHKSDICYVSIFNCNNLKYIRTKNATERCRVKRNNEILYGFSILKEEK